MVKPGKLSTETQVGLPPQLVPLSNGKFRHIASFTLKELHQIGWDGAMYRFDTLRTWVPYIDGYDSDDNDRYEPFDQREARRQRIVGLPLDEIGKFMKIDYPNEEGYRIVQLKK